MKLRCCAKSRAPEMFVGLKKCQKPATIERFGKLYCIVHDPEAVKKRLLARETRYRQALTSRLAAGQRIQDAFKERDAAFALLREYLDGEAKPQWHERVRKLLKIKKW